MKAKRLVIIGGGSAYTPDIVRTLGREPIFHGWTLVLHDVDAHALDVVARLSARLLAPAGMRVEATVDRGAALQDAAFVLTQPRVGGLRHRALDEQIPRRHGVIGQETLGAGGLAFAWRTIPLLIDVMAEVQRLAPTAWVINYANPAGMVTEAVLQAYPQARFIGLCDMPSGLQWGIAKLLRRPTADVYIDYRGINHGGWVSRVVVDGRDRLPGLRNLARLLTPVMSPSGDVGGTLRLWARTGKAPDAYLRYYYFTQQILEKQLAEKETRAQVLMRRVPGLMEHYEAVASGRVPALTQHRGHAAHADLAVEVMAVLAGAGERTFVIQQINRGSVSAVPYGQAAQFPARVGPQGFTPLPTTPLTATEGSLLAQVKQAEMENVAAALHGDRAAAVRAMAEHPLVGAKVAEPLTDALLAAHRAHLPQFFH